MGTLELSKFELGKLEFEFRTASPSELPVACELLAGCELPVGWVPGLFCTLVAEFAAGGLGFAKDLVAGFAAGLGPGFATDFATDFPAEGATFPADFPADFAAEGVTKFPADRPPAVLFFAMASAFSAVIIDRTPVFIGQSEFLGKSACNRLARTEHLNIL